MNSSDKIKLVVVVNEMGYGGTQKVVVDILNGIDHKKFEVSMAVLSQNIQQLKDSGLDKIIKYETFDHVFPASYSLSTYFKYAFFSNYIYDAEAKRFQDWIITQKPDLIHFHTLPRELSLAINIRNRCNAKFIFTDHSLRLASSEYSGIKIKILSKILKKFYKGFHITAVSKSINRLIVKEGWVSEGMSLTTIENQIQQNKVNAEIDYTNNLKIVYLSRIANGKGHADLIEALKQLNVKYEAYFIGRDELNGSMQELAATDQAIHFLGEKTNVAELLSGMHMGVFPSHREGLPIALLEMMATGLPIIASDIEEIKDIIVHNNNGLLYQCGNSKDLKEKLELLIGNQELRKSLGSNAKRYAELNYMKDLSGMYMDFYISLL